MACGQASIENSPPEMERTKLVLNGGYDLDFIDKPPDDLLCLICILLAKDPVQASCCGKIFCTSCLNQHLTRNKQCPNCRKLEFSHFKDLRSDRNIRAMMVRCPHMDNGCSWVGEVMQYEQHVSGCGFRQVICPNMCTDSQNKEVQVLHKDLQSHLKEECTRRLYECPHCQDKEEYKVITGTHMEVCPHIKVNCPNENCPDKVKRKDLAKHRHTCSWEKVPCRFECVGCKVHLTKRELERHEKEEDHAQLAREAVLKLHERLKTVEGQLVRSTSRNHGNFTFKLTAFSVLKNTGQLFFSPAFYTSEGGYKMCIRVVPNGDGQGKDSHISVYAVVMKGEYDDNLQWPIQGIVTVELLNQLSDRLHHTIRFTYPDGKSDVSTQRVIIGERAKRGYGKTRFIPYDELGLSSEKTCQHLKDDCLFFRVNVETPCPKPWLACSI